MIPPPDCSVREDDPCVDAPPYQDEYRGGYEPDLEDLAYDLARGRELEETVSYIRESERQLHASTKPNRQLREISKESKSLARSLWEEHRYDVADDSFDVPVFSDDDETSITVPRDGVCRDKDLGPLSRKDKRRLKKRVRKLTRLGIWKRKIIWTKRGCSPRQVKGYEDRSFTPVVAAK
jgi:hypothetical protein